MNKNYYKDKIISNCYIMLIVQGFATLIFLMNTLNLYFENIISSTGYLFFKFIAQATINYLLLFRQKKNPTLLKSILILMTTFYIGTYSFSGGISVHFTFLGMVLVFLAIVLNLQQIKYNQSGDEE